jgi:hypothetical protein
MTDTKTRLQTLATVASLWFARWMRGETEIWVVKEHAP